MRRVAILIDGGFLLKRLPTVRPDVASSDADAVDKAIGQLVRNHLKKIARQEGVGSPLSLLYRCFYYDAEPYQAKAHRPISKLALDYSKTPEAVFRLDLFDCLRRRPNFAVRLGEVRLERPWVLKEEAQKDLLRKARTIDDLSDDDFQAGLRQKAVDMRLAIDIVSLTLKKQVDTIVLVTGDSDFVPAAKLARREGVRIILDPLRWQVTPALFEHIDALRTGFHEPNLNQAEAGSDE